MAPAGVCTNCGYDLAGLPEIAGACPECGMMLARGAASARAGRQLPYAVSLICWGLPLSLTAWFLPTTIRLTGESGQTFPIRHAWPLLLVGCGLTGAGMMTLVRSPMVVMSPARRRWIEWLIWAIVACIVIRLSLYSQSIDAALSFFPSSFSWNVDSFLSLSRALPYPLGLSVFVLSTPVFVALSRRSGGSCRTWAILRWPLVPAVALAAVWVLLHSTVFWEQPLLWRNPPTPAPNAPRTAASIANAAQQGFPTWYTQLRTVVKVGFMTINTGLCVAVWVWLMMWKASVPDKASDRG